MIIGIDASKLSSPQPTGVEVATTDLIKTILNEDSTNIYWLYSATALGQDLPWSDRIKNVIIPGKKFWTQRYLSREIKNRPPDVFWSPSHILPNHLPKKSVATIHDLAFYLFPQSYSFKDKWLSTLAVERAAKRASKLVAVSQQTKKDLKRFFKIPGENIEVVYHALRSDFIPEEVNLNTIYPELNKYFLCVGRIELRKNIPNLLRAFAQFATDYSEIKLVLAGQPGYGYLFIKKLIKRLGLIDKVKLLSYVPSQHLPILYAKSQGVVFASQYEGFGFPILEGWASGVPVLTSNYGAMAEIADKAAFLVDPQSITEITSGLKSLFTDQSLRQKLIEKGKMRLAEFSWEKSAQKIIALWNRL